MEYTWSCFWGFSLILLTSQIPTVGMKIKCCHATRIGMGHRQPPRLLTHSLVCEIHFWFLRKKTILKILAVDSFGSSMPSLFLTFCVSVLRMMFEFGICKCLRSFCCKTCHCSCFPIFGGRTCVSAYYVHKSYRVSFVNAYARMLLLQKNWSRLLKGQIADTSKSA